MLESIIQSKTNPTIPTTTNNTIHFCLSILHYFCSWFPAGNIARSAIKTWFYFSGREIIRDIWLFFYWSILSSFTAFTSRSVNVKIFAVFIDILIIIIISFCIFGFINCGLFCSFTSRLSLTLSLTYGTSEVRGYSVSVAVVLMGLLFQFLIFFFVLQ